MPRTKSTITVEQVEAVAVKLRDLPPAVTKDRPITKQETVRILFKEIRDLQKRGYTLEQVAELLKTEGIQIGTASLRSYLQRAGSGKRAKQQKTPSNGDTPPGQTSKAPEKATFKVNADTDSI